MYNAQHSMPMLSNPSKMQSADLMVQIRGIMKYEEDRGHAQRAPYSTSSRNTTVHQLAKDKTQNRTQPWPSLFLSCRRGTCSSVRSSLYWNGNSLTNNPANPRRQTTSHHITDHVSLPQSPLLIHCSWTAALTPTDACGVKGAFM